MGKQYSVSEPHLQGRCWGGGTLGVHLVIMNMDVVDVGIPLLSMHSPDEISSKVDIWYLFRTFTAFYKGEQ